MRSKYGKERSWKSPGTFNTSDFGFGRNRILQRQSPSQPKGTISYSPFEVLTGPKVLIFASLTNASISSVESLQEWQVMLFSFQKCLDSKIGYTEI